MAPKKEVQKHWLHHATEDSVQVEYNSKEYKAFLKDGYRKTMVEVLEDRGLLEQAEADKTEGTEPLPLDVEKMSDEELLEVYGQLDDELVKRGLLEAPSKDDKETKDVK